MGKTWDEPTQPHKSTVTTDGSLLARYQALSEDRRFGWVGWYRKVRLLGVGGQGAVYLCERQGADGFSLPVALKLFSPEHYSDAAAYEADMRRTAQTAARAALIQHDNVLDVLNFVEQEGVRIMVMEWVDGYDLSRLLANNVLDRTRRRLGDEHWEALNRVVVTAGPVQPRLKPGVAVQVLRECLAGLAALHRSGIAHGDVKPSNVMLKRTGSAKLIDIGSAVDGRGGVGRRFWSPLYAAPEVLEGGGVTPRSDLASLGYILVEMLAGQPPFAGASTRTELLAAKRQLEKRLPELLPPEVACNELLVHLCRTLTAADPDRRCASAEAADMGRKGAAAFHRQLVKGNLASDYQNDLRVWLDRLDDPTDVSVPTARDRRETTPVR